MPEEGYKHFKIAISHEENYQHYVPHALTQPKEIVYPVRDQEILSLLESIKNEKWRFAIQLLSVYGLRPEE